MFYSFLVIAVRNFLRRATYYGINIFGLSVGLSIAAIVLLYVQHELTYDNFHYLSQQVVRFSGKRGDTWFGSFPPTHSRALLENEFHEVESIVRLRMFPPKFISNGKDKFYESKVLFTDSKSNFFNLFQFPILYGNTSLALQENNSVVLTESIARKLFGEKNAVGKSISFDTLQLVVTAVLNDLPSNSHMDFSVLICNDRAMESASGHFTYGVLNTEVNIETLREKLMGFQGPANSFDYLQDCRVIPLQDLHYEANLTFEMKPPGNKMYFIIFVFIGVIILILSCFNFINLSIAIFTQRAKEIAVRKVVGAYRLSVFVQLLFESIIVSLICYPIAMIFLEILLPSFNNYMGIRIHNLFFHDVSWFIISLFGTMGVGLFSGIYPAWILPRINSVLLFKSNLSSGIGNIKVRSLLVGFQILIMVLMLSGSWIIEDQLKFTKEKDLGFTKEGIFKLSGAGMIDSMQFASLKSRLLENHSITTVTHGIVPGDEDYGTPYKIEGSDMASNDLISFPVGKEYIDALGIKILQADYDQTSEDLPQRVVLINETFAKLIGKDCIGQQIVLHPGKEYEVTRTINGIFRDFHFFSLHQPIVPMMISFKNTSSYANENILIKFDTHNLPETTRFINKTTLETIQNIPLTLQLLDDSLSKFYEKEHELFFFSRVLLAITIVLSILGLVGIISFTTELRAKEISIRKILGAPISSVLLTMSISFLRMAAFAFVAGSIISFVVLDKWLSQFAYKAFISAVPFVITLISLVILLLCTVGWLSIKAANANPLKALRCE